MTNPAIILADEPTGALDSASTAEVLDIFDRLNDEGRTVIVITHEADVAERARPGRSGSATACHRGHRTRLDVSAVAESSAS